MSDEEQTPDQEQPAKAKSIATPEEAGKAGEIKYLPVVGLDDEADGRDEDITPDEQAEAKTLTEHT